MGIHLKGFEFAIIQSSQFSLMKIPLQEFNKYYEDIVEISNSWNINYNKF